MKNREYARLVGDACQKLYGQELSIELTRPEEQFGDYSTNAAMQLANKLGKSPREIAEQIAAELQNHADFNEVSVAGPGFINIRLADHIIYGQAMNATDVDTPLKGQKVVAEYSDPNPFKILHAGHLYTSLVGDAVANITELAGAKVHRVNFGGDVGLHVAKTMWAIIKELGGENPQKLHDIPEDQKLAWVSERYVGGNEAYEKDEAAGQEILEINKRVYKLHEENDRDSGFAQIYWTTRQWSYDGFNVLYDRLGMVQFEKYYPESATAGRGVTAVEEGLGKGVFKKSDGAVVFEGEKQGLHTRVFMNSEGLPTYEAKDLGLALTKWEDYHFDSSLIITGNDIAEYMKVVVAATRHFSKEAAERTRHLTHGQIKLAGGVKMSSRKGNIVTADDILDAAFLEYKKSTDKENDEVVLGAVRYSFLRGRIGSDIIYDPKESVSLDGNSGPYIQYALVRARSILRKAEELTDKTDAIDSLDPLERSLSRKLSTYPEVFSSALADYSPHHICSYLYELAQIFNRFYEKSRVIDDERSQIRIPLVGAYEKVLSRGLELLGMPQPEKM